MSSFYHNNNYLSPQSNGTSPNLANPPPHLSLNPPLNPLVVHHYQGCIDLHGQSIPHGLLFAPGPDECQVGVFMTFRPISPN